MLWMGDWRGQQLAVGKVRHRAFQEILTSLAQLASTNTTNSAIGSGVTGHIPKSFHAKELVFVQRNDRKRGSKRFCRQGSVRCTCLLSESRRFEATSPVGREQRQLRNWVQVGCIANPLLQIQGLLWCVVVQDMVNETLRIALYI